MPTDDRRTPDLVLTVRFNRMLIDGQMIYTHGEYRIERIKLAGLPIHWRITNREATIWLADRDTLQQAKDYVATEGE